MRKQELLEELENAEEIRDSQEPVTTTSNSDADLIQNDPELEMLAARLEQSAPRAPIDPAFKKALRDQLLDILAKHSVQVPESLPIEEAPELPGAQDKPGTADADQHSVPQDSEPDAVQNTFPTALVEHLEATAPSAASDPAFKKALRDQLLDIQAKHHVPVSKPLPLEEIPGETEKVFDSNAEESHHLNPTRRRRRNH